ncbi:hypothetical protein MKW92_002057 [Papaver armeniacum]|nr:hypothetical protein MKW92_002057 [Papaver armeniacum]
MDSFNKTTSFPVLFIRLHFLLFLLISITLCPLACHGCHEEERRALLNFKSSLEDPLNSLSSWNESVHHQNCCEWHGIQCSRDTFHVISIDLPYMDHDQLPPLRGKLSPSLSNITYLEYLDLSFNNLHWNPTRMFEHPWPKLQTLRLSSNKATGSIPSSISNAPMLVSLSAFNCGIQGSIPSTLYNLPHLQHLNLSYNNITSYIHSSISNLKKLKFLDLSYNNFQGPIPKSICKVISLRHLALQDNNISESIPSCITKLHNLSVFNVMRNSIRGKVSLITLINELNLTTLGLSSNKLTAVIDQHLNPSNFRMESLQLGSCNMKGFTPTFICNLTFLQELDLSSNNLEGVIPSCISKLKNLLYLDMSSNKLQGPLPLLSSTVNQIHLSGNELSGSVNFNICSQEPGKLSSKTEFIDLSNNSLSGVIPSSIGYCTSLKYLNLCDNNISGTVPNELEQAKSLIYLQIDVNNLEGTFPESIQKLKYLEVLQIGDNNFQGSIPTGLGSLNNLKILSLRSNKFNGSIPNDIVNLHELQILDLSMNNLSGPIPMKLGNLAKLTSRHGDNFSPGYYTTLRFHFALKGTVTDFVQLNLVSTLIDLSSNILEGSIPEEISLLKGLGLLNLSHNLLSDNIPTSVGNMSSLESLDLSSNRLWGNIPQSLTLIDSLGFLNLSYNNLSGKIPRGNHFDTLSFDGSAFAGNNLLLCGLPTQMECMGDHNISTGKADEEDQEDGKEKLLLYAIIGLGFGVGFWGLFCILLVKKHKWWFPYWRSIDFVAARIVGYIYKK